MAKNKQGKQQPEQTNNDVPATTDNLDQHENVEGSERKETAPVSEIKQDVQQNRRPRTRRTEDTQALPTDTETPGQPMADADEDDTVEVTTANGMKVRVPRSAVSKGVVVRAAEAPEGHVAIVSADGRVLEASIGDQVWHGKTIYVPAELEGEVRRILTDGHYFIR